MKSKGEQAWERPKKMPTWLNKMQKIVPEVEILKRTQAEMKMELEKKILMTKLEKTKRKSYK